MYGNCKRNCKKKYLIAQNYTSLQFLEPLPGLVISVEIKKSARLYFFISDYRTPRPDSPPRSPYWVRLSDDPVVWPGDPVWSGDPVVGFFSAPIDRLRSVTMLYFFTVLHVRIPDIFFRSPVTCNSSAGRLLVAIGVCGKRSSNWISFKLLTNVTIFKVKTVL